MERKAKSTISTVKTPSPKSTLLFPAALLFCLVGAFLFFGLGIAARRSSPDQPTKLEKKADALDANAYKFDFLDVSGCADRNAGAFYYFKMNTEEKSFLFQNQRYSGFRFKADHIDREGAVLDLVWYFSPPYNDSNYKGGSWYIHEVNGSMKGFFGPFKMYDPEKKEELEEWPNVGEGIVIQDLDGSNLEKGKEYIIWFAFGRYYKDTYPIRGTIGFLKDGLNNPRLMKYLNID